MSFLLVTLPFVFLGGWLIYSSKYVKRAKNNFKNVNPIIFDNIPTVFTTIGVFGTFLGISVALFGFNVSDIDSSIPELLNGLKVAFASSIIGIFFSWLFQQFLISPIQYEQSKEETEIEGDELKLIAKTLMEIKSVIGSDKPDSIGSQLESFRLNTREQLKVTNDLSEFLAQKIAVPLTQDVTAIKLSLSGDEESSLNTQLIKLRNLFNDQLDPLNNTVTAINQALEGDQGLKVSLSKWQEQQAVQHLEIITRMQFSEDKLDENKAWLEQEFKDFSNLLSKSNTEALVEVIEQVIGGFNEKLNELIEKLVKENFEQLNESVENLNKWQQTNKEQVESLIDQYKSLTEQLKLSADTLENVSKSTSSLVNDDSKLVELVTELDTLTKDGDNIFVQTAENLKSTSEDFTKVSGELKNWFELHIEFGTKIQGLIDKLGEIEQLRDKSEGFFNDVKKEFEAAAGILQQSNTNVRDQVDQMREAFNEGMDRSFTALDDILQTMVLEYAQRMKGLDGNQPF